jgi:hypothetical protein
MNSPNAWLREYICQSFIQVNYNAFKTEHERQAALQGRREGKRLQLKPKEKLVT